MLNIPPQGAVSCSLYCKAQAAKAANDAAAKAEATAKTQEKGAQDAAAHGDAAEATRLENLAAASRLDARSKSAEVPQSTSMLTLSVECNVGW